MVQSSARQDVYWAFEHVLINFKEEHRETFQTYNGHIFFNGSFYRSHCLGFPE